MMLHKEQYRPSLPIQVIEDQVEQHDEALGVEVQISELGAPSADAITKNAPRDPDGPTLALLGGWLLAGIVAGACGWSGARVDRTSPFVVPSESSSSGSGWGPLAVVSPQGGADRARNEGTLRITETCVVLVTRGGPVLLVWPADRTTWNAEERSIAFANYDGSTGTASDGAHVVVGGSGDSIEESGMTTEAWLARTRWVARPVGSCPLEARWWVGALTR